LSVISLLVVFSTSWRGAGWRFFDPGGPPGPGLPGFGAPSGQQTFARMLLRDLCAGRREGCAGLAAEHVINQAGRDQLTDPAQPDEARGHKVVVSQAMPGVGSDELVDAVPHPPTQVQIGEGPG
jgi:hypothetical protein